MTLKTHNCPDRIQYDDPSQFLTLSGQGHWQINGPMGPSLAHTHVDLTYPIYAEFDASTKVTIRFKLTLFHTPGKIVIFNANNINSPTQDASNFIWDATGNSTPPDMTGDPMGIKTWGGTFDIVPNAAIPHGWTTTVGSATVAFDNGDSTTTDCLCPYFSVIDITKPEVYGFPALSADIRIDSKANPTTSYGFVTTSFASYIPTNPINAAWAIPATSFQYSGLTVLPPATSELRFDLDLHNGIPGTTVWSITQQADILNKPTSFDPALTGTGTHKFALMRFQPANTNELAVSLLVVFVTVGTAPPIEKTTVPNVVGLLQADAITALTAAKLVTGTISNVTSTIPIGTVISQSFAAGLVVPIGTSVDLSVSSGPPTPDDGVQIGTINKRKDGTTCVCGIKGISTITTDAQGNPCIILDKP